jgi:prepilin-type N-terminal cleavage/methylation domain-containing protein
MNHPPRAGFTLIETMTVVAVIAILATLALPSIRARLVRDQIVEAMKIAEIPERHAAVPSSRARIERQRCVGQSGLRLLERPHDRN